MPAQFRQSADPVQQVRPAAGQGGQGQRKVAPAQAGVPDRRRFAARHPDGGEELGRLLQPPEHPFRQQLVVDPVLAPGVGVPVLADAVVIRALFVIPAVGAEDDLDVVGQEAAPLLPVMFRILEFREERRPEEGADGPHQGDVAEIEIAPVAVREGQFPVAGQEHQGQDLVFDEAGGGRQVEKLGGVAQVAAYLQAAPAPAGSVLASGRRREPAAVVKKGRLALAEVGRVAGQGRRPAQAVQVVETGIVPEPGFAGPGQRQQFAPQFPVGGGRRRRFGIQAPGHLPVIVGRQVGPG
ncbi:MAG: hypothetical protein BWY73_01084 [candidate division TA06 bacterium ADurb.Bin417]|uniref:Uncharacterized protein n=1 Tax=candidate division TA06 bacterium ADurb.Bin417 TaxID=1852828 RepID=A0A1V5ME01_UNCT6|nr:MAG: hypothetical protein BWY73_01084 [candidate division TA06 bacterium ADurb.Bin417]